jgi:hypothetical protein
MITEAMVDEVDEVTVDESAASRDLPTVKSW